MPVDVGVLARYRAAVPFVRIVSRAGLGDSRPTEAGGALSFRCDVTDHLRPRFSDFAVLPGPLPSRVFSGRPENHER
jgi:hypothetical protein